MQNCQESRPAQSLFHKGITACLPAAFPGEVVAVDGEQHHQRWMRQRFQLTCDMKAIQVGQFDIQNHQIRLELARLVNCFCSFSRLAYYCHVRFIQQQPAQALSYRRGIVNKQDAVG